MPTLTVIGSSAAKPGYDDALFRQTIERLTGGKPATDEIIEDAFWIVCPDLKAAIVQQAGKPWEEVSRVFRKQTLPGLKVHLRQMGVKLAQEEQ